MASNGRKPAASFLPLVLVAAVLLSFGCAVGPKYNRPGVNVPNTYRGLATEEAQAEPTSLGDQNWPAVFQDEQLQDLIRTALQQNYDVRIAATRILQARAFLGISRADQFPDVAAGASASNQRIPASRRGQAFETSPGDVSLSAFWELDFWGKFRRASEAARADLLATEWARQAIITSLVSDVAGGYYQLRELDLELEIAQRTLASRQESLQLVRLQEQQGAASLLEVRQAEQLVFTAAELIPDLERRIEQQENFISTLLGNNPGAVARGRMLTEQPLAAAVPPGLPSALLERRPDIRLAEQQLIAANARIGVAKAAYFPQITLTAAGGFQSSALSNLFSGPAGLWSLVGGLTQPIFTAGRIRSNVQLTEAQQQELLLVYQRTIQQAFREVSDGLIGYRKSREFRVQQESLAESAQDAARLSDLRYRGGATSYLEVLDSNTRYFSAELGLTQARLNELLALVELYRALGGGWQ
jgi:multidrug efflux system outer membrane protein